MVALIFFLGACLLMGIIVLIWDRHGLGEPARLDQYERFLDRTTNRHSHIARLTSDDDRQFLNSVSGGEHLIGELRRSRQAVLRLTLLDLSEEFSALFAVASMLAASPTARDGSFGVKLVMRAAKFRFLFILLYLSTYLPAPLAWRVRLNGLAGWVQDLRESTRLLLASLTPSDMDFLRKQILN